jgi:hypothetical protein
LLLPLSYLEKEPGRGRAGERFFSIEPAAMSERVAGLGQRFENALRR